jgi:hypothetical protein
MPPADAHRHPFQWLDGDWTEAQASADALLAHVQGQPYWHTRARLTLAALAFHRGEGEHAWAEIVAVLPAGPASNPGDNLFRDGCVGAIDAHHGSSIQDCIKSLKRIRASDVEWLLPSHGPVFRKDNQLIDGTIARLETYLHLAEFGTCAIDGPLIVLRAPEGAFTRPSATPAIAAQPMPTERPWLSGNGRPVR